MDASWSGARVLVTGAGGFIGSHLAERLAGAGARVRALVHYSSSGSLGWLDESPLREKIEVVAGDVTDRESVRRAVDGVEAVFHLAALVAIPYSYHAPGSYVRTNVEGTLNLLLAARDAGVGRFVHTSTSEVYGTARYVPIDEQHPLTGQSPYSATKIGADKLAEAFHLSFGLPVVTVRPFNTFGPRQSARAVIPDIITQCLTSDRIVLGNLKPKRDMNYVANTVDGFVLAAQALSAVGKTFNLGSGREISIEDLAALIARLIGRPVAVEVDERRVRPEGSEVDRLLADNSRALSVLGWKPSVSLEQGLEKTVDWVRGNLERYRAGEYVL